MIKNAANSKAIEAQSFQLHIVTNGLDSLQSKTMFSNIFDPHVLIIESVFDSTLYLNKSHVLR